SLPSRHRQEILSICLGWSSITHLAVEDIQPIPLFSKSLKLKSTKFGRPGLLHFRTLLADLQTINTSTVVIITRPPEIIACLKLTVFNSTVFVIFDSHPRPELYPDGGAFIVSTSLDATAQRLADLLPVIDLPDADLQWQAQLLANYSGHIFVSRGLGSNSAALSDMVVESSLAMLSLQAEVADLKSQNASLTRENKRLETELEDLGEEHRRQRRTLLQLEKENTSLSNRRTSQSQGRSFPLVGSSSSPWPLPRDGRTSLARSSEPSLMHDDLGAGPSSETESRSLALAFERQRQFDEEDRRLREQRDALSRMVPATFECSICMEEHSEEYVARLDPCRHGFCRDCLRAYVASKLDESRFPVLCPVCTTGKGKGKEAIGEVTFDTAVQLGITDAQNDRWVEMEMAAFSVMLHCRKCKRSAYVDKQDMDDTKLLACPFRDCNHLWCKFCQQAVEIGGPQHSCDGSSELDHLMRQRGWKYCPCEHACRTATSKSDGCNHMTCISPACNTHFCYVCGGLIIRSALRNEVKAALTAHYRSCSLFEDVADRT
ncbi:hypothetical protein BV25DRAFT_1810589, partial [Artomyces pyxidatus]